MLHCLKNYELTQKRTRACTPKHWKQIQSKKLLAVH